jgi:hypothetical protein
MAKEDDAALKRILFIEERQAALIKAAESLQSSLLGRLIAVVEEIRKSPDPAIDKVFDTFTRNEASTVVGQFAKDIMSIGGLNAEYFGSILDLPARDYKAIQANANDYLLKRFGLGRDGRPVRNGFLESFITDPTVRRAVKQYAYKTKGSGVGVQEFTKGLGDLLSGDSGPIVKYYKTFALDTYQQADREIQEQAAQRLNLTCFLYAGGLIKSSRAFCLSKNGKVFTRDEALAWKNLEFDGKPTNYDPLRDLGGYNCRHHKNYITDKMAIRRRPELADVLKPGSAEEQPKEVEPEVRQTPPPKLEPKADTPKVYRDQAEFEAALKDGGWSVGPLKLEKFNEHCSGVDVARIGKSTREQLEASGLGHFRMRIEPHGSGGVVFNVDAETKDRKDYFTLSRIFHVEDGLRTVEHSFLQIPKDLQGKGFTKELFGNWYQEYKAAGLDKISLHANIDVGGYAWAKYGFECDFMDSVEGVLEHAFSKSRNIKAMSAESTGAYRKMKDAFTEFYANNPVDAPFPMDVFANIKGGKELMLGSDWFGSLNLKNPERRAMWEAYLNKK